MSRYNSIIYTSLSGTDYLAVRVNPEFLDGDSWNLTLPMISSLEVPLKIVDRKRNLTYSCVVDKVKVLQSHIEDLTRFEGTTCNQIFNSTLLSSWGNVLVVSNVSGAAVPSSFRSFDLHLTHLPSLITVCPATPNCLPSTPQNLAIDYYGCPVGPVELSEGSILLRNRTGTYCIASCPTGQACLNQGSVLQASETVDYCLAEAIEPLCKVYISPSLLFAVLVCNFIKVVCLILTLNVNGFNPLVTVGDAIASFIRDPDKSTNNYGALASEEVQREEAQRMHFSEPLSIKTTPRSWDPRSQRWLRGKTGARWDAGVLL